MRLAWVCIFSLSVFMTPSEATKESWDFSSLLSALNHGFHGIRSEKTMEKSLSRKKRETVIPEYTVDIEISFPDPSFQSKIKQYIENNSTLFMLFGSNSTTITSINVTTACNQSGSDVQCSCEDGYSWPSSVCTSYSPCTTSDASNCSCIKGTSIPSQYCQANPVTTVNTNLRLTIRETFTSDLMDPLSFKHKKYKDDLEKQFYNAYKHLNGFISANITAFRPGSILADYTVVTEAVSTSALTAANSDLITNLQNTSYPVDPTIRSVITDSINVTINPGNVFPNDKVILLCTANITSYTSVAWMINSSNMIVNSSYSSYTTTATGSIVQSTLTINRASQNDSGTYRCIINSDTNSYQAQMDLNVQPMDLTVLNTSIPCTNTDVPVIQCCTQGGNASFDLTGQIISGSLTINGITKNSSTCKTYTISADPSKCTGVDESSYSFTCFTGNGAVQSQTVKVTFTTSFQANITAKSERISEGTSITLECKCNGRSVKSMSWSFNGSNSIPTQYYTNNLDICDSNLTIPSSISTVAWNGIYYCAVNNGILTSKVINVFRLAKPNQIRRSPIDTGFTGNTPIAFSCCLDYIDAYKPSATLQITTASAISTQAMLRSGSDVCYNTSITPGGMTFTATCTITNLNNDTVTSDTMTLTYIPTPTCTYPFFGVIGTVITVPCENYDPTLTGNRTFICSTGGQWQNKSSNCVLASLNVISNQVAELTGPGSAANVPNVLGNLSYTVTTGKQSITSSTNNIQLVINILQQVQNVAIEVQPLVMKSFLETVDIVVDNSSVHTWKQISNQGAESSNLLQSVEKFAEKLTFNESLDITTNINIQLVGKSISNSPKDYNANFNFSRSNNLTGNVLISKDTLNHISENASVISIAYATLKDILNTDSNNTSNTNVLNGLVMTTIVTGNYTNFKIEMDFKKSNETLNKATCVYWNFTTLDWDSRGCNSAIDGNIVKCNCSHLTSFSILMSLSVPNAPWLDYVTYIGVGISILSLVICIIIEAVVWKSVTKNKTSYMRHICIINIAVTLLMADIWFIVGAAVAKTNTQACVSATFFAHLFYLCVFFWMLTMGLILFYRLMCVFHDLSKTTMMGISFFLGYGCPVIISVITVAVTQSNENYIIQKGAEKLCWLNIVESKAFLAFVVPAFTILFVNFITLLVVIVKVLRPSIGDRPKKEEKSTLNHITKCILILTPLLGLTWGFGIGTMSNSSLVIHGIFSALNSLQGLFILLFGCLMDKKVRDSLLSKFSLSRWSSQQTKTSNVSSSEPPFSKGVINLFAKRESYTKRFY
ncbi:adhesion G protein-coupled receptor F5 isoform X2 [Mixophyes fleayi]|uniref:adhesion G protein-coupled receptor F5 isoform X2 n=1 Tax=Mixophyes fleayi TaxID=3061075 RepID=UPI003F4D97A8